MAWTDKNVTQQYQAMREKRRKSLDDSYAELVKRLDAQKAGIGTQYDAARGQSYANARVSALGNNEALAAKGLSGNAYGGPQSGYTETSRVGQDVALRNALDAAYRDQTAAENAVETEKSAGMSKLNSDWASAEADIAQQENAAQQNAYQVALNKAQAELQNYGRVMTQDTADILGMQMGQQTEASRQAAQQAAWAKAQAELQNYGRVMTQESADILGMNVGDQTESARQADYQNAWNKAQAELQMFGEVVTDESAKLLGVKKKRKRKR